MPVHLRPDDGVEYETIQRELSLVPELVFDSTRPELPRYIRSDCLEHYWKYFHPSFPIVYKPNFVKDTPPPLLLSAILAIGSFYDSRPDARQYSLALQEIATKLLRQRESITSRSRIADLQTVLLFEIFSKYYSRHTIPETSARFRHLFASLHQTRQILVQNPLAVYKTLKSEKSEDDLKRAHKFWLEHEARRRIFYACTVLDSQQVLLFSQRPTIISHVNAPRAALEAQASIDLPCDEELWEANPLKEWSVRAASSAPQDLQSICRDYQAKRVGDYSFFQHQIINTHLETILRCADEALSPRKQDGNLSKTLFNYNVFHMARATPIKQLLIVSGESWFLGRKIEEETEFKQAKQCVRDWIAAAYDNTSVATPPADSLRAFWHALKMLRMVIAPSESTRPFRSTNMLHEDWVVYLAALVCWAHWYGRNNVPTEPVPAQIFPAVKSRKRKNTEVETPTRKRKTASQNTSNAMLAPPHTMQAAQTIPTSAYLTPDWSPYSSDHAFAASWAGSYYESQVTPFTSASSTTAVDSSAYASSVTATANTRTATNTPQSQSSRATTAVPSTSIPSTDESVRELQTYLIRTNVPDIEFLAHLDLNTLNGTKGLLNAVRIHKIGGKRVVGGLMNNAERVLSRLVEGRSADLF